MIIILSIALVASLAFNIWIWIKKPRNFVIDLNHPSNRSCLIRKGDTVEVRFDNYYARCTEPFPDSVAFPCCEGFDGFGVGYAKDQPSSPSNSPTASRESQG